MKNNERLYVDGIADISLINGVVHLTCANLAEVQDGEERKIVPQPSVALSMPLNGFLQSLDQMAKMAKVLEERGVLVRRDGARDAENANAANVDVEDIDGAVDAAE